MAIKRKVSIMATIITSESPVPEKKYELQESLKDFEEIALLTHTARLGIVVTVHQQVG